MNEFKLIVAGGRDFDTYGALREEILFQATEGDLKDYGVSIVSGMARGADALGVRFAREHNVKLYEFPADWNQYGKGAGFIRNKAMGDFADGLLAFWDGQSRGTQQMLEYMRSLGKRVQVVKY